MRGAVRRASRAADTIVRPETSAPAAPYSLGPWDLSELLPAASEEVVAARLASLERQVEELAAYRPRLAADMPGPLIVELLRKSERVLEAMAVLGAYASLWFAADTQSAATLAFRNRMQQALTEHENRLLFLRLWWKELSDQDAERLLGAVEGDADLLHHLRDLRRTKPYTLAENSEQIINLKDADGVGAVLTVYSMLTNRFEFTLEEGGVKRKLNRDELMSHAFSPDPALRAAVYRELYRVYGEEAAVLGQLYTHRVRDWHNEGVGLRGYASPIAVRNVANDIPDGAVDTLLEVCRAEAPLFQRYFRLKASWLGMERLRRYDLYAPVAGSRRTIPFAEGAALVLDTFRAFDPRVAELAERVFAGGHLDSELRKGKRGGAFCATVLPALTPWVLINYTGRVRDVATLAHELGHAVHSMLGAHHSILTQQPSLPLAETASVFAEMLLTDRLLREERDPMARRELLAAALDDIYATVLRQAWFVRFELAAHRAVLAGRSTEELNDLYLAQLREQFGDAVEVGEEFRYEWLSIPHIYSTPFYCYAYSFGQLLVLSLYRRFRAEGEAFKPAYLRLLSWGGGARPVDILAEAGVDPNDPAFWRGGFDVIRSLVDELESSSRG
jgi:oligoendopeptidase F